MAGKKTPSGYYEIRKDTRRSAFKLLAFPSEQNEQSALISLPSDKPYLKQNYYPVSINPALGIVFDPSKRTIVSSGTDALISYVQVTELVRGFKLAFPVTVKIERIEEGLFVGECPMLNISIPAENYEDALDEIKEVLVDDYQAFLGNYPHGLTKEALNTLRLYCALFGEDLPK